MTISWAALSLSTFTSTPGAGAYVCGEETALLESMEGKRGMPRIRPPYPTVRGFRGMPTVVNNVETLANIPPIILNGAAWYRGIGTKRSPGTKVYTMMGDVNVTGLIETPMGTTLREVIDIYGGGMKNGKAFKCAQTGGSSGTIIPADLLDVPMDFASMAEKGAGLGSGALLIADEDTDIVDLAYVLVRFFKTESCGKCTPCRVGTRQMLEALERLQGRVRQKGGPGAPGRNRHLRAHSVVLRPGPGGPGSHPHRLAILPGGI